MIYIFIISETGFKRKYTFETEQSRDKFISFVISEFPKIKISFCEC